MAKVSKYPTLNDLFTKQEMKIHEPKTPDPKFYRDWETDRKSVV